MARKAEGSDEHIVWTTVERGDESRESRTREESSGWRCEVTPKVGGCPWDTRPVGRTSPTDAFSRVGRVWRYGSPENPAPTGTAATEAGLPTAEALQPDDGWADTANTSTASGRRMHITDAMVKFGASMGSTRCKRRRRHMRVECACSAEWRRRPPSRHRDPRLTWLFIDRSPKQEAKSEAMIGEEMQSWVLLTTRRSRQAAREQLGSLEEQETIVLVPRDFPLAGAKRIRSMWLDNHIAGGVEVKSRLVATEVACKNRDDCPQSTLPLKAKRLVVSLAASRGRRLLLFIVVAAVHALVDDLVILLLRAGLGQGRTAVLHKALCGTRKASRLWQRFLCDVLAVARWKASVIFALMYTLGDRRGTLVIMSLT